MGAGLCVGVRGARQEWAVVGGWCGHDGLGVADAAAEDDVSDAAVATGDAGCGGSTDAFFREMLPVVSTRLVANAAAAAAVRVQLATMRR